MRRGMRGFLLFRRVGVMSCGIYLTGCGNGTLLIHLTKCQVDFFMPAKSVRKIISEIF